MSGMGRRAGLPAGRRLKWAGFEGTRCPPGEDVVEDAGQGGHIRFAADLGYHHTLGIDEEGLRYPVDTEFHSEARVHVHDIRLAPAEFVEEGDRVT
ncbi:MAG: hypothetical protein RI637_11030, partial [Acidimicrobiia bacterium]|nr:hypothetical protein [Acidimicrobiia bacterium]